MAKDTDPAIAELVAIKKLLILLLVREGLTQSQVASALEIDRTSVSRLFPKGALSALAKGDAT